MPILPEASKQIKCADTDCAAYPCDAAETARCRDAWKLAQTMGALEAEPASHEADRENR